jgi:hypothetical protein
LETARKPQHGYQLSAAVMLVKLATLLHVLVDPNIPDSSVSAWLLEGFLLNFLGAQRQRAKTDAKHLKHAPTTVEIIEGTAVNSLLPPAPSTPNTTSPSVNMQPASTAATAAEETLPASRKDFSSCLVNESLFRTLAPVSSTAYSSSLSRALVIIKVRHPAGIDFEEIGA